jgi:hypothetical protein
MNIDLEIIDLFLICEVGVWSNDALKTLSTFHPCFAGYVCVFHYTLFQLPVYIFGAMPESTTN